ncbi:substrate-binding domain-containing protein [Aliiglaciecola sp.]|nr:substrate-binding domain-containing protein [Aliiglaciecola sp.]
MTLFQPIQERSELWRASHQFAKAVASDLNVTLEIVSIDDDTRDRFAFKKLTLDTLEGQQGRDFVISLLYGGGEYEQLEIFNRIGIPFITFNSSLGPKLLKRMGQPRQQFKHWIAHVSPDEFDAGAKLVADLINHKKGKTIAFLGGATNSVVNRHRIQGGLKQAKLESVVSIPPIYTDWSEQKSIVAAQTLLKRAPDIDMIWTAAPEIALGVSKVISASNHDAVVGSFDWTQTNFDLIKQDKLQFTYGGHFMDAGWTLIMIFDYLSGVDFENELGNLILSNLEKVNKSNVSQASQRISSSNWSAIDFGQYSKCLNPLRKKYNFQLPID